MTIDQKLEMLRTLVDLKKTLQPHINKADKVTMFEVDKALLHYIQIL